MIRIVHADDHVLFRAALRHLLKHMPNVSVVAEAGNGEEALALARELNPDLVLMYILMPGMGGLEATQRLTRLDRAPAVIALTSCVEPPFPAQMLKAGALGYLTKNVTEKELGVAIKRVFAGRRYVCNEVAQDLASYAFEEHTASPFETLSNRELQIMMMVINCQKVSEISAHLHLSPKTVNSYRYRIFEKLKISSDVEMVLLAVKHGMVANLVARTGVTAAQEASSPVPLAARPTDADTQQPQAHAL